MGARQKRSLGCQTCRQRKIKCDRAADTCMNCKRSGWKCPGYPDSGNFKFRDETVKIRVRAQKAESLSKPRSGSTCRVTSNSSTSGSLQIQSKEQQPSIDFGSKLIQLAIPNSLEDVAECYFLSRWAFGWQPNTLEDGKANNGCLITSIRALGIARLLRGRDGPSMSSEAHLHYVKALQLTNQALADPVMARMDSTLFSVNLLSFFEMYTDFDRSPDAWVRHIEGAAALLELRGDEQFRTPAGGLLFVQTAAKLITSCMIQGLSMPQHLWKTLARAEALLPEQHDPAWVYLKLSMRYTDFAAWARQSSLTVHDACNIIKEAIAIDEATEIALQSPALSEYVTIQTTSPFAYGGFCHFYDSYMAAQIRNAMLCYRIMLRSIVHTTFSHCKDVALMIPPDELARVYPATAMVRILQLDIIASIPQHLGVQVEDVMMPVTTRSGETWSSFAPRDFNPFRLMHSLQHSVRLSGGDNAHRMLQVVGMADPPGSPLRAWVVKQLRLLGQSKGIKHALMLATQLEQNQTSFFDIAENELYR